jgi:hypothetical protein
MRKSAESADDMQMPPGVLPVAWITDSLAEKSHRQPLVLRVLRVFERQIAEQAMVVRRVGLVEALSKNLSRGVAGLPVGGE